MSKTLEHRSAEIEAVYKKYLATQKPEDAPAASPERYNTGSIPQDDAELIERMLKAKNGADLSDLLSGDTHGYPSHSEADLAMCNHLAFWTGKDPERMKRIWLASGLYREKLERADYTEATISLAIEGCSAVYEGKAAKKQIDITTGGVSVSSGSLPQIIVTARHMRDITDESLAAMQAANERDKPFIFIRAGLLSRVDDLARVEVFSHASLKGLLDRAANYMKAEERVDPKTKEVVTELTPARPPADVMSDILSLLGLGFPQLNAVATVPQALPGGGFLVTNGYDAETKTLLYAPGLEGVNTEMPLEQARDLIMVDLLGDFPITDDGGKAHAVAMLLQAFLMLTITGACPMFLIDAPTRGTGKTLLYKAIARIILGVTPPIMTLTRDGGELDKRITASLLEGDVMLVFDNVSAKFQSDKLEALATSRMYRGRRLGKSEMVTVQNNATIVATGNNVEVGEETARRIMPIRLDAGMERPEQGRRYKHADLEGWVMANRVELVSACLSLITSWQKAGMPKGEETIGSFESWAQTIGGILAHAGIPGLLTGLERFSEAADSETNEWRKLTDAWWQTFGQRAVNATELFNDVIKPNTLFFDLWAGRSDLSAKQRIGRALTGKRDRIFGKYAIRSAGLDGVTRTTAYRLEERPRYENASKTPLETLGNPRNPRVNPRVVCSEQDGETKDTRGFQWFLGGEPPTLPTVKTTRANGGGVDILLKKIT